MKTLMLEIDNGKTISIKEDTLLVFLDETGNEKLKDKKFPIFGLGGCAIPAKYYHSLIDLPWKKLRKEILGNPDKALHAAELKMDSLSKESLNELGKFFVKSLIKRIATVISDKTFFEDNYGNYQVAASVVSKKITEISLQNPDLKSIAIFFEHSDSGNKLIKKYFRDIDFKNHGMTADIERYIARKGVTPGLDIADFIMHAAGTQTKNRISGDNKYRQDFEAVFKKCAPELQYFLEITKIKNN